MVGLIVSQLQESEEADDLGPPHDEKKTTLNRIHPGRGVIVSDTEDDLAMTKCAAYALDVTQAHVGVSLR